jgi:ribosomal protein L14
MVQLKTRLYIVDNTGVKLGRCIRTVRSGNIGDFLTLNIKTTKPLSKIKEGSVEHGILIRSAVKYQRKNGISLKFDKNCCVLLNNKFKPKAKRFKGVYPREASRKDFFSMGSKGLI